MALKFFKVTALPGSPVPDSMYFVSPVSPASSYAEAYVVDNAGVARYVGNTNMITEVANSLINARDDVIFATAGGSANAIALSSVSQGTPALNKEFWFNSIAVNSSAKVTASHAGIFGGAATKVILPNGEELPPNAFRTGYPAKMIPTVIGGNNRWVLTYPTFEPQGGVINLEWAGALTFTGVGTTAIAVGNVLTGASSGATARVVAAPDRTATGTWAAGTRAGTLYVDRPAAFTAGENLQVSGVTRATAGGPVNASPGLIGRMTSPAAKVPADGVGPIWAMNNIPYTKPYGGPAIQIINYDGEVEVQPARIIRYKDNTTIASEVTLWNANESIELQMGVNPATGATTGIMLLREKPDYNAENLYNVIGVEEMDIPPYLSPVMITRVSKKRYHVKNLNIAYDDDTKRMNQNVHHSLIYNMGEAMSNIAALQNPYAWALNSEWVEADGRILRYGAMSSEETGGGSFDQIQPSIAEVVGYYGPHGTAFSATIPSGPNAGKNYWTDIGIGHGHVRMKQAAIEIERYDHLTQVWSWVDITTMPMGKSYRGRALRFTNTFDMFRRYEGGNGYECIGELYQKSELSKSWTGWRHSTTQKFGRAMSYNTYGTVAVAEGSTITGATSGATAKVAVIPAGEITSGTIAAGTAAGKMNVYDVVGTFTNGENLQVGGVTRMKYAGYMGPTIGVQQNFAFNLITTTVNRAKVNGQTAVDIGKEESAKLPDGITDNPAYVADLQQGSRLQVWHTNVPEWIYEVINMNDSWVEGTTPVTPPGAYPAGQGTLSGFWMQLREEGLRKGYNSIYTGVGQNVFEGKFEYRAVRRFRNGTPT